MEEHTTLLILPSESSVYGWKVKIVKQAKISAFKDLFNKIMRC